MFTVISQWFQDWSDACEYASECAPDFSFLGSLDMYSALASIAGVCYIIWWHNERQIQNDRYRTAGNVSN